MLDAQVLVLNQNYEPMLVTNARPRHCADLCA